MGFPRRRVWNGEARAVKRFLMAICTVLILVGLASQRGNSMPPVLRSYSLHPMPMFARKYGVPCETCHTTIPRLNEVGYKFRAAGYRFPEQIGKEQEKKFDLGDYFSARIQGRYDAQWTNQPNGAAVANIIGGVAGPRVETNSFNYMETTLYPLTGSWGKYLGSLTELSFSPEDFFEVENAYVRFVKGNERGFFTARGGIFHSWEGFGASDRPYSNGRPLFQTTPISAGGRGVPFVFQPWGLDEAGVELGYEFSKLSVRAALLSGTFMRWDADAASFLPFPSQTGPWKGANQAVAHLNKPFNSVAHNTPDFSAIATYLLNSQGGGISLLYYRGNMATPTACTNGTKIGSRAVATDPTTVCGANAPTAAAPFGTVGNTDFDFTAPTAYRNNFDRVALYAAYPIGPRFFPNAGFTYGRDTAPVNPATYPVGGLLKFDSKGAFAEGAYVFNQYLTGGVRYDWFRPRYPALNTQWAITPYVNIPFQNGFQIITEYQHRDFQINATNHRQNDSLQARLIFIW